MCYQKSEGRSKQSPEWSAHVSAHPDSKLEGDQIPYLLVSQGKQPEMKLFKPPDEADNPSLDGFRRVQLISQPLTLLDPLFPALQLIEDFTHFAGLLEDMPPHVSDYRDDIQQLNQRAQLFIRERDQPLPAFSSFSQIREKRQCLTVESQELRHCINMIIRTLCNDPDTAELVRFIKGSAYLYPCLFRVSLLMVTRRAYQIWILRRGTEGYGQPYRIGEK